MRNPAAAAAERPEKRGVPVLSGTSTNPCILLDRDGVLNLDRPDSVTHSDQFEPIESSLRALRLLHNAGYTLLVITNQACVGRGEISRAQLDAIHNSLRQAVDGAIDDFFVCDHAAHEQCDCRKPKPGLIHQARAKWRFDPAATFFVGDATRDVEAAQAAGCRPVLVKTGKGLQSHAAMPDVPLYDDLLDFAQHLLKQVPA